MRAHRLFLAAAPAFVIGLVFVFAFAGCSTETIFVDPHCTLEEAQLWGCGPCPIT